MDDKFLLEVAKQLQGRYGCLQEIDQLTRETEKAFSRNDTVAARIFLKMRGEIMERADSYMERIEKLVYSLEDASEIRLLEALLKGRETAEALPEEYRPEAVMIISAVERSRNLLAKVILKDRAMNSRITGKESFYSLDV